MHLKLETTPTYNALFQRPIPAAPDPEETHMIALRQPVPADVLKTILDCAGVAYGPLTVTVEGDWMILSQK